jgi:hypothetical protein
MSHFGDMPDDIGGGAPAAGGDGGDDDDQMPALCGGSDDEDGGEDDGGGGGGGDSDADGDGRDDGDGGEGGDSPGPGGGGPFHLHLRKDSEEVKLMRQYLASTLVQHQFISMPALSETGQTDAIVFQLLSLEERNIVVQTFHDADEEQCHLYNVSVQIMERWRPLDSEDGTPLGSTLDVFVVEEPVSIDILRLCGSQISARASFLGWQVGESDLDGCIALHTPEVLKPSIDLLDPKAPALALVDRLLELEFEPVQRIVKHEVACVQYDSRIVWYRQGSHSISWYNKIPIWLF